MESLTLGLDGTNPRFPWKPSATMLNYRLIGSTERIGVNHNELGQYRSPPVPIATATSSSSSPAHGAPRRGAETLNYEEPLNLRIS